MDALLSLAIGVVIGAIAYLALTATRIRPLLVQIPAMVAVTILTASLTERPSIGAAGLAVVVLFAFVLVGHGVRHLHDLHAPEHTLEPVTESLPRPFAGAIGELRRAGFEQSPEGPRRQPRTQLLVTHLARPDGACATALGTATGQPRVEIWSILDPDGSLLTSFAAKLSSPPGERRQVFLGATPTEMVRHHEDALARLAAAGVRAVPVAPHGLADRADARANATRLVLAVRPGRAAATAMWRELTRRYPDCGPIVL